MMDENMNHELRALIKELQKFDNPKGYKLTHKKVQKELQPVMEKIGDFGEESVELLHSLLEHEETWSCWLALQLLERIKSERSIYPLIEFIRRIDDSEYWELGEDTQQAFSAIGKPAVSILIQELHKDFSDKKHHTYLLGALAEIQDGKVTTFMLELLEDYSNDYKKYDGWFDLVAFVLDCDKLPAEKALPLLEKLLHQEHLSVEEKTEIEDTIIELQDPGHFEREVGGCINPASKPDYDSEEFWERANEPDEDFVVNFRCNSCKERQNLKTGLIWNIGDDFAFEYEIMCRHCHSHDLVVSDSGKVDLSRKQASVMLGREGGMVPLGEETFVENKKILFKDTYNYILQRIDEKPKNAELYLRAGNIARKRGKYLEAVEFYTKSMELDELLIANYINLIEIYAHRAQYYGLKEYQQNAEDLFTKLLEVSGSHDLNLTTIRNPEDVLSRIHDFREKLGFEIKRKKVGRNEPCSCGSGIKYKKCCLE